jgi:hypothetical protein
MFSNLETGVNIHHPGMQTRTWYEKSKISEIDRCELIIGSERHGTWYCKHDLPGGLLRESFWTKNLFIASAFEAALFTEGAWQVKRRVFTLFAQLGFTRDTTLCLLLRHRWHLSFPIRPKRLEPFVIGFLLRRVLKH